MSDPFHFPFKTVTKENLVPGENYYIKLNDRIIQDFLSKRRNLPVSHVRGTFVKLHTEVETVNTTEYAVFRNVRILNKKYKMGLCNMMLVRQPEGFLASAGGCDTYSDRDRTVNEEREVFFDVKKWIFGIPTEQELLANQVINTSKPTLNTDMVGLIGQFRGTNKGGKTRRRNLRTKKRKNNRKRKSHKRS
jgi:hypothetical protein